MDIRSLCAILLACAFAAPARAQLFELAWNARWGWGDFTYNHDAVDRDPDPAIGVYDATIYRYHFGGWNPPASRFYLVDGFGGSIVVRAQSGIADSQGNCLVAACTPFSVSIAFGAATADGPAHYRMELRDAPLLAPEWDFGDGLPPEGFPWGRGNVFNDRTDDVVTGIGWNTWLNNAPFAGPVPEPAMWAMFGVGLLALAARRRR
jgi:hypothetical protein